MHHGCTFLETLWTSFVYLGVHFRRPFGGWVGMQVGGGSRLKIAAI